MRIINLETAITSSEDYWRDKPVLYRMHPQNIDCLTAARIDCCCLANNHLLDWGAKGLEETLATLDLAGLAHAGAGRTTTDATAPAVLDVTGKGRVLVFSFGSTTSGIPRNWRPTNGRPGVAVLDDLSEQTAQRLGNQMRQFKRAGDVTVASIHWGPNWGYEVPAEQIRFAHRLIEEGVDIVHGHSSHHVKAVEIYRERLILYGCGDFLTDYEGISGHERFRSDLALMYLPKVDARTGWLTGMRMVPLQAKRFRLHGVSAADARWLCELMNRFGTPFGTQVQLKADNSLSLRWVHGTP